MSDLNFITATKQTLWNQLKAERANSPDAMTACNGYCSDDARRHIRQSSAGWTFIEGKKLFGVAGTLITFCPYCGRKLNHE